MDSSKASSEALAPIETLEAKEIFIDKSQVVKEIEALQEVKFYEVSKIRKIVSKIDPSNESALQWKKSLLQAVAAGNELQYGSLTKIG
jgi:hypothetical protein